MRVSCNTLLMDYGRLTQSLRSHVTSTISLIYNTTGYNSACRNSTSHCVHDHLIHVHFGQVSSIGALFLRNRICHLYSLKATSTDSLRLDVPRIRRLGHRALAESSSPTCSGPLSTEKWEYLLHHARSRCSQQDLPAVCSQSIPVVTARIVEPTSLMECANAKQRVMLDRLQLRQSVGPYP